MKIDLVRTIVAIGIGALIGWGFYALAQDSVDGQPLVLNAIYAYTGVNTSFYILNGIISLILLLTVNGIYKSKQ